METQMTAKVFSIDETHGLLRLPGCRQWSSSERLGWTSMLVTNQYEAPFDVVLNSSDDHLVVLPMGGGGRVHGSIDGQAISKIATPGDICVWPAGSRFSVGIDDAVETVHVYIRGAVVAEVANAFGMASASLQLMPVFGRSDELLEQLLLEAWRTARSDIRQSSIYADQLALSIASRLIWWQHRDTLEEHSPPECGGLTARQLRMLEEYVEAHLGESICLQDLSIVAKLSRSYFVRQFKLSTRLTPHQFVLRRRVARSKSLLRRTRKSISQIAFECGFAHQEHLTQTFKRQTGTTPAEYRKTSAI